MADEKQQLLNRLKTVEGHVRGVQRMVESDTYCIDIIKQTQAIQRALDKFNSMILANHLNTCVTTAIRGEQPEERERVIAELMQVFEATNRLQVPKE
ncbi:MAG: metal-sensitive transcriptional regulator [Chloroflexota bacterium]